MFCARLRAFYSNFMFKMLRFHCRYEYIIGNFVVCVLVIFLGLMWLLDVNF